MFILKGSSLLLTLPEQTEESEAGQGNIVGFF